MAIDSQRASRAQPVPADAWLGPVLVAHGVLTPRQADRLRAQDGHSLWTAAACLPMIILTAQHGETEEKALDLGADDYLGKPVQTRSLVARVRAELKRASA